MQTRNICMRMLTHASRSAGLLTAGKVRSTLMPRLPTAPDSSGAECPVCPKPNPDLMKKSTVSGLNSAEMRPLLANRSLQVWIPRAFRICSVTCTKAVCNHKSGAHGQNMLRSCWLKRPGCLVCRKPTPHGMGQMAGANAS